MTVEARIRRDRRRFTVVIAEHDAVGRLVGAALGLPVGTLISAERAAVHQTVWIAGRCHSGTWDFHGVFLDEQEAVGECVDETWFVAPAVVGHALLHGTEPWPGLYRPMEQQSRIAADLMDKHGASWADHLNDEATPPRRRMPWL